MTCTVPKSSIAVFTDQGSASLGFVSNAEVYGASRCALFERRWQCRNCGEVRYVEGASLAPPVRSCRWCGKEGSDWMSEQVDFKTAAPSTSCCSKPVTTAPVRVPLGAPPRGTYKALLIGLNYYSQGEDLQLWGSVKDVQAMERFLAYQGWPNDAAHMRILLDDRSGPLPTRDLILAALEWLVEGADAGSNLFLQFSGQGVMEESCILTADLDVILEDELFDILAARLPRGARLTAIFDGLHPMPLLRMPKTYTSEGGVLVSRHPRPSPRPLDFPADVVVLQTAPRGPHPFCEGPGSRTTGLVVHSFLTSLLECGTCLTWGTLLTKMEQKFQQLEVRGLEVSLGCLEPREFDPLTRLTLTADHTALKPLSPGEMGVLVDLMPDPRSFGVPEMDTGSEPPSEGAVYHAPHTCADKHCCTVFRSYDVLRTPHTSLAAVPIL